MVFVHGFGASIGHFRKNVPALSQDYKVRLLSRMSSTDHLARMYSPERLSDSPPLISRSYIKPTR